MKLFGFFVFVFFLVQPLKAENARFRYVMCSNKNVVRTIRVDWDKEQATCYTTYTKRGQDRVIGNGKFFESCVQFLTNVQKNLEGAGWSCKDISQASIHQPDTSYRSGETSDGNG